MDIEYMQTLRAIRDIDQDGVTEDTFHDVSTCLMGEDEWQIQSCNIHSVNPICYRTTTLINRGMLGVFSPTLPVILSLQVIRYKDTNIQTHKPSYYIKPSKPSLIQGEGIDLTQRNLT